MIPLAAILDLHERLRHVRYKLGAKAKAQILWCDGTNVIALTAAV